VLKETVWTLRVYFLLLAVLSAIVNLLVLAPSVLARSIPAIAVGLAGLALAVALLWVGLNLSRLIFRSPALIQRSSSPTSRWSLSGSF